MSDTTTLLLTASAVLAIIVLIVKLRFNPVIALVLGAAYLGLVTGLGPTATVENIATGFGDLMAEIGLLVGFGVLIGALLREMGAIERLVGTLVRLFGQERVPYALALSIVTFLQSIFLDVLLVISAPLARGVARTLGRWGTPRVATAMAISLECGIVFTVPGVAALALAGLLDVPLGRYLLFGLIVVIPTVVLAIAIMGFLFRHGFWNPELDEDHSGFLEEYAEQDRRVAEDGGSGPAPATGGGTSLARATAPPTTGVAQPSLLLLFAPLLTSLVLIAGGALAEVLGWSHPVLAFVSAPVIALLLGLVGTCWVARAVIGQGGVERNLAEGLRESGQILLLNGVGGSLAAMIAAVGMDEILGQYFEASTVAPLLVVWGIAALLHVAVGSVTVSAITSAGLLAPVAGQIGLDPVLIALAAGAGSLFLVHLTSNTFWLLQSLLGQTTRGALKTVSVGVSVASVVALGPILVLSLFL